jgi:hypothetical protein
MSLHNNSYTPEFCQALNLELQAERVHAAYREADAARSRGVSWSGLSADPRPPRTMQAIAEAAAARVAARKAWLSTPQGAFASAIAEGQQAAGRAHDAAETARAAASRDIDAEASLCSRAAAAMEAQGRRLIAAARRARRAIRSETRSCA